MNKKKNRRRYIIAGIVIGFLIAANCGGAAYLLHFALQPHNRGKNLPESWTYMRTTYPHISMWLDSITRHGALLDTLITDEKGVSLHACYMKAPHPTARTAMIVHGYTDNAVRMMHIGYLYAHELHFNVILPDLRYSGLSGGEAIQMGWLDRLDVERWIRLAPQLFRSNSLQMVVHGISMGAATTMMVSGDSQPDYVKCFVEDCGYTSVWDQFHKQLNEQFHLPAFPLLHTASFLCQQRFGWNFKEASALHQVAQSVLPIFFIHGEKDTYVPTSMVYTLYDSKVKGAKERWIAPGSEHAMSYHDHPQEYTRRVHNFVSRYLH